MNKGSVIATILLLFVTLGGLGAAVSSLLIPGNPFDWRRYAADNMCNVNPGSCNTEQDWISGWFAAREPENQGSVAQQPEYTNARDDQDSSTPGQQVVEINTGATYTVTGQTITQNANGGTVINTSLTAGAPATLPDGAPTGIILPPGVTQKSSSDASCGGCGGTGQGRCDGNPGGGKISCMSGCDNGLVLCPSSGSCQAGCPNGEKGVPNPTYNILTSGGASTLSGSGSLPKDWTDLYEQNCKNAKAGDLSCCGTGNLACGGVNDIPSFCVPGGMSGTQGCDAYILQYNYTINYGGVAYFERNPETACGGTDSKVLAQIADIKDDGNSQSYIVNCTESSEYSQCAYISCSAENKAPCSGQLSNFKCYKEGANRTAIPEAAPFYLDAGGCLVSEGGGAIISGYYCQGAGETNRSNGCQDPTPGWSSGSQTKICPEQVAGGAICGVVQVDADGTVNGQLYHYSTNIFSTAGCGTTALISGPVCGGSCTSSAGGYTCSGGSYKNPSCPDDLDCSCGKTDTSITITSNPPPSSPPPPGSPVCVDVVSSISSPTLGDEPTFTCLQTAEATSYEFRYRIGDSAYQTLPTSSTTNNVSDPLAVNTSGEHVVQCRPCNTNGCANWDNI